MISNLYIVLFCLMSRDNLYSTKYTYDFKITMVAIGLLFCGQVAAFESNGHFDGESEVYSARHVKHCRDGLRIEAGILYQLRNAEHVVQLEGLYDGLRQSVLVTDFLCGGDLCERVSSPNFILNESKCKRFVKQICQGKSSQMLIQNP